MLKAKEIRMNDNHAEKRFQYTVLIKLKHEWKQQMLSKPSFIQVSKGEKMFIKK